VVDLLDLGAFRLVDQKDHHLHLAEGATEADTAEVLLEEVHHLVDHDDQVEVAEEEDSKVHTSTLLDLSTRQ
jgi:hypothetical protein